MAVEFRKGITLNNQRAQALADPSAATDAATKQYVDNVARGLDWKESARAASTADIAVASAVINGAVVDGVTLATGDRVLLKNQTTGSQNGIYVVVASGAASRSPDADSSAEVTSGMAVTVTEGTVNGDKTWVLTTNDPITLGTTALAFSQLGGGSGNVYVAGAGLTETAGTFDVVGGAGLSVTANSVDLDTAVVARIYQADCAATTNPQTFTHGLGKRPLVEVVKLSDGSRVFPDVTLTTTQVTVDWGAAPTAAEYRVLALG